MSTQGADMNNINLTPLPEPDSCIKAIDIGKGMRSTYSYEEVCSWPNKTLLHDGVYVGFYSEAKFRAGQIAAVEKDRAERGGVPDAIRTEAANLASILGGMVEGGYSDIDTLYTEDQADGDAFVKRASEVLGLLSAAPQPQPVPDEPVSQERFNKWFDALPWYLRSMWPAQPQPVQEAKRCEPCRSTGLVHCANPDECGGPWTEPTTQPVQREPLTDEQIDEIWKKHVLPGFGENQKFYSPHVYARAIEAAHGITKKG